MVFRLNILCRGLVFGKCLSMSWRKFRAIFDLTDLLNGGLYQMTFRCRFRLVVGEGLVASRSEYCNGKL